MQQRNITPPAPRRSDRISLKNQMSPIDPTNLEPKSRACKFCSNHPPPSRVKKVGKSQLGLAKCGQKKKGSADKIGVKRKRNQGRWTLDQELALKEAYWAVTPGPAFWKKISRRVPGKSAQECHDKHWDEDETDEDVPDSPPVLKPIKNEVLHRKYIDKLLQREAKRKAESVKNNTQKEVTPEAKDIEAVKNALVLDAKNFNHEFQRRVETSAMGVNSDEEDDDVDEGVEDDGEEDDIE